MTLQPGPLSPGMVSLLTAGAAHYESIAGKLAYGTATAGHALDALSPQVNK